MIYCALALILLLAAVIVRLGSQHKEARRIWEATEARLSAASQKTESGHQREIRRLLDALPDLFFSISHDGKIIRHNSPAAAIFQGRELDGRSIRQIFLDASLIKVIDDTITTRTAQTCRLTLPARSSFSPLKKPSHWVIEAHPVSLQSDQIEAQLIMRNITDSVMADQVRQDFVANASHELRTPLAIISGYLENLTEEGGLDHKPIAEKMLGTMSRHVERINLIIEDMLVISKLESNDTAQLHIKNFSLADCVQDIINRLDLMIENQNATIVTDLNDITLNGDLFYWTQLLFNLIENALKQNSQTPIQVTITATQNKEVNSISISDNGIGIPREDLAFIFKRFYRVEKHHSQNRTKGTGLGLSIVKRAVEAHGGNISVTSTPGIETTFTIEVPHKLPR